MNKDKGFIGSLRATPAYNETRTENNMPAYKTTYNACLDLFFLGASYRTRSVSDIISLFTKAYKEDATTSLKILAYFRDAREGSGERRFFRTVVKHLAETEDHSVFNIVYIPILGRWDDLLIFVGTPLQDKAFRIIADNLTSDQPDGLCAKWMPRKGKVARLLREHMELYPKQYRQLLVRNTRVVETQMCNKQWTGIVYSHVPSVANVKYNKAFLRNDEARRREFLKAAKKGNVKINSSVAYPHTIVGMMLDMSGSSRVKEGSTFRNVVTKNDTAIAMWKQLPNIINTDTKRILVCADTSGSMRGNPILISTSLALYCSERLKGPFQNAYISFSAEPRLQYTEGDLYERLCQLVAHHPSNTNFQGIFKLVLDTAIKNRLTEDEMPTDIAIISDLEFDRATGSPNDSAFTLIRKTYADAGYDMPNIIFWNVNARNDHFPIQRNSKGVALISGSSQNAIKSFLEGVTTPVDVMLKTVNIDRYSKFIAST